MSLPYWASIANRDGSSNSVVKLDERDLKLLAVLQQDGRISKHYLAKRINLSPAACWKRLQRLERAGVIEGYSARISPNVFGQRMEILVVAELESHRAPEIRCFESAVTQLPQITDCWAVGGGVDYILKIACRDIDSYQRLIDRLLDADVGLKRYCTYVVTKAVKTNPVSPILFEATKER